MRNVELADASATAGGPWWIATAAALILASTVGSADAQTLRSRGTIDQVDGNNIGIKTLDGYRTFFQLAPFSMVSTLRPIAPAAIAKGQTVRLAVGEEAADHVFVVAAAQVFPADDPTLGASRFLWDMTGLGSVVDVTFDRVIDRPAPAAGQREVPGTAARVVIYGRPVTVVFPPGCPVTTFVPAGKAGLRPGTPVFVYGEMSGDHPIEAALTDPGNLAPKK